MKNRLIDEETFSVVLPEDWEDITEDLGDPEAPLTLAAGESGVGILQISDDIDHEGELSHITTAELGRLLEEFAEYQRYEPKSDRQIYPGDISLVGQSFQSEGDFVRVWYASDGKTTLLVTYICEWPQKDVEDAAREVIARSIRFKGL